MRNTVELYLQRVFTGTHHHRGSSSSSSPRLRNVKPVAYLPFALLGREKWKKVAKQKIDFPTIIRLVAVSLPTPPVFAAFCCCVTFQSVRGCTYPLLSLLGTTQMAAPADRVVLRRIDELLE